MPKYLYKCESCEEMFLARHLMSEVVEVCEKCGEKNCLKKLPSFPINLNKGKKEKKVGEIVNNFIKDAKEDIKKEKKQMKEDYKP
mgnify:CR=1 FL=1|tara:strand:+ start:267 stop:521 length:255 start_codon:yes stop_codon:yes gene_type:complete